jgi:hypothetical protein
VASFKDNNGDLWQVDLDGFSIEDATKRTGINLADVSAGGYATLESDAAAVVRVLAVLCEDEIKRRNWTAKQFSKGLKKEAIEAGRAAIWEAAADFFPASEWSAIQQNWTKRKEGAKATRDLETMGPLLEAISRMPPDMRMGAVDELKRAMRTAAEANTASGGLQDNQSATGPETTLSPSVTDSPERSELPPAA